MKKGSPAAHLDEIVVAPEEYEKYLTLAYRAEPFPKPSNFIGMVKSLPVPEMEKLMLTHIKAGDEELRRTGGPAGEYREGCPLEVRQDRSSGGCLSSSRRG